MKQNKVTYLFKVTSVTLLTLEIQSKIVTILHLTISLSHKS